MGLHIKVEIGTDSGTIADTIVNTWNVATNAGGAVTPAKALSVCDAIAGFYRGTPAGQPHSLGWYLSPYVKDTGGIVVKAYDSTGKLGPPVSSVPHMPFLGSPIAVRANDWPELGTSALPSQLAAVITTEGTAWDTSPVEVGGTPPTRPRSRHRGRVYLGPLSTNAMAAGPSSDAKVSDALRASAFAAFAVMRDAVTAVDANWKFAVWSRADGSLYNIVSLSMDDRLDVVQSRKRVANTRTRVTV